MNENETAYQMLVNQLTKVEFELLKAVAKEQCVREINASGFIRKYNLKSASSLTAPIQNLTEDELLYRDAAGYRVYDRFLSYWLSQQAF